MPSRAAQVSRSPSPWQPVEVAFSSQSNGAMLAVRLIGCIEREIASLDGPDLDVRVMIFAFTDPEIRDAFLRLARGRDSARIRFVGDWKQGSPHPSHQLACLARCRPPNVEVRFKKDQPYVWDRRCRRMRWSYRASRGLLHHKTISVNVGGRPALLVCGTYNWTGAARRSYENLMIVRNRCGETGAVLAAVEREFDALWADPEATLSPDQAAEHYALIENAFHADPAAEPESIRGIETGPIDEAEGSSTPERDDTYKEMEKSGSARCVGNPRCLIAFTARRPCDRVSLEGYHSANREWFFEDRPTPGRRTRRHKVTPTNLAMRTIARAEPDEQLLLAMHGLSVRVPEFSALLTAARRGVRCEVILDRMASLTAAAKLCERAAAEDLPLRLLTTARTMHQKYLIHPESATVVTGTANMSLDARDRHSEHRLIFTGNAALTRAFTDDFRTMAAAARTAASGLL